MAVDLVQVMVLLVVMVDQAVVDQADLLVVLQHQVKEMMAELDLAEALQLNQAVVVEVLAQQVLLPLLRSLVMVVMVLLHQ
jgi:hypothetical protein